MLTDHVACYHTAIFSSQVVAAVKWFGIDPTRAAWKSRWQVASAAR